LTSARAIATRCCWPPDSSAGRWAARSARPTCSSAAATRARRPEYPARGISAASTFSAADQVEGLEHEPDRGRAQLGELVLAELAQFGAVQLDGSFGGPVQPAEQVQQGGFAVPGAALHGQPFAIPDHQVQVPDGRDGAAALLVELGHAGQLVHEPFSCS
jgi:hypothetical protein